MDVTQIKEVVEPIAKDYGVEKVALFGSFAKGTNKTSSDLDLIIKKGRIKDLFQLGEFISKLEDVFNREIDVLTYEGIDPFMATEILNSEVILYEAT